MKIRLKKFIAPLLLLMTAVVFYYPVIFLNRDALPTDALLGAHIPWVEKSWPGYPAGVPIKNLEITDSISQFYPWKNLVADFWRNGKVPLWNPYMFNGYPMLANLHSAALYPLNVLYLFFSKIAVWNMFVFLQIILSMFFMYVLLRYLKLGREASFFGSVTYAFSGYMISWLEFTTGGHAALWLPILFYLVLKVVESGKLKYALSISVVFTFIYLSGDFQAPLYITLVYFLYSLFLLTKKRFKTFSVLLLSWLGGVGLSSIQIIPTIELFTRSIRFDDPRLQDYMYGMMAWKRVVNFLWPDFFGNVVTGNYWAEWGCHEYMCYTGIISVGLLLSGIFRKKVFFEKFIWVVLIISLLFAFPFPTAYIPYRFNIPGLSTSSASRIIILIDFCISVISAFSLNYLVKKKDLKPLSKSVILILLITTGIILGLVTSLYILEKGSMGYDIKIVENIKISLKNMLPQTLVLTSVLFVLFIYMKGQFVLKKLVYRIKGVDRNFVFILVILVIILIHTLDLLRFAWKNTPFSKREFLFPTTPTIEFLQNDKSPFRIAGPGFPLNYFVEYRLESAEGYDPIYPYDNGIWYSIVNSADKENPSRRYGEIKNFTSHEIDYANVKYVIDYKKNPYNNIIDRNGSFQQGLTDPERFTKVFEEKRVSVFLNDNYLPRVFLFTDVSDPGKSRLTGDLLTGYGKLTDKDYLISDYKDGFNEVSFNLNSKSGSYLFLSQSNYPGWRAFVNDKETDIETVRDLFQSIKVPSGESKIKFIYSPRTFIIGKYISLGTLLFLVIFYLYEKRHTIARR